MSSTIAARICEVVITIALLSVASLSAELAREKVATAIYAPHPMYPWPPAEVIMMHLAGEGVCLLYLRPDGTVERAEMLVSTGQPLLDKLTIKTFSKWRFVPGPKKVTIPITYTVTTQRQGSLEWVQKHCARTVSKNNAVTSVKE
jgi:TonB family protein